MSPARGATTTRGSGLDVRGLSLHGRSARRLRDIDLVAQPGDFVAVVGASGTGKSTLLACLAGLLRPSAGTGTVGGVPLDAPAHARAGRVGYVPQDDALHGDLSVRAELTYAAEIRGHRGADRDRRVHDALIALGISGVAQRRIAELSGGERKRVSVAVELLSSPDVLLLDEATSGLDPGHERDLVHYLRRLTSTGCAVVLTTHSVTYLDEADTLLLLGVGGVALYCGPPAGALTAAGVSSYVDLFPSGPDGDRPLESPELPAAGPVPTAPRAPSAGVGVLVRRELARLVADRRTLLFLALQAPVLGLMVRAMIGPDGLQLGTFAINLYARRVILTLVLCAVWLGSTNSAREIVRDREVLRRERVAGVRGGAVLAAKLAVMWTLALGQVVVLCVVALAGVPSLDGSPVTGSVLLSTIVTLWVCAGAAGCLALAISAFARSTAQALAILPLLLVPQLVLSGGVIALADVPYLRPVSYLSTARWGLSGVASAANLREIETSTVVPHPATKSELGIARHEDADRAWDPTATAWGVDLLALVVLAGAATGAASVGLRRV